MRLRRRPAGLRRIIAGLDTLRFDTGKLEPVPGRKAAQNIKPYPLSPEPTGKINVTDPDSRNLKTTRASVQGYNARPSSAKARSSSPPRSVASR
jgi:hypothetical protein